MHKTRHFKRNLVVGCVLVLAGIIGVSTYLHADALRVTGSAITRQTAKANNINILSGQWSYMPAVQRTAKGLQINQSQFKIVNQDGSGGQENVPVNLYGTHVTTTGDYQIAFTLSDFTDGSTIELYSAAPIVQDEFRVDPSKVRVDAVGQSLRVSTYKAVKAGMKIGDNPATQERTVASTTQSPAITISSIKGQLSVTVNNQPVLTTKEKVLSSGQVWFGAQATKLPFTITGIVPNGINKGSVATVDTSKTTVNNNSKTRLYKALGMSKNSFSVGTAASLAQSVSDNQYAEIVYGGNFSSITTENALKWQFVEPSRGAYNFTEGDALYDMASRSGMKVHGHTLVFSEANPAWVSSLPTTTKTDKVTVKQVMNEHITNVVTHYSDKISSWDVVNEPLADYDDFNASNGKTLRNNVWYQAMGEEYISQAFATAHSANPSAKLYMNEYGLEGDGERWDTFYALVKKLKESNVPIDGVGFQAHVYESADKIDPATLRAHIAALAAIGVSSRISEIDVYSEDGASTQAQQYSAVYKACVAEPSCESFTTWGVSDRYDMFIDDDGTLQYGEDLLWDSSMRPTSALKELQKLTTN